MQRMLINEVKKQIEEKNISFTKLIFIANDDFIPIQYINEISTIKNQSVKLADDLSYTNSGVNLFIKKNDELNLFITDKLDNLYGINDDTYIICKTINKSLKQQFEDIIIEVPKLDDWQIRDYFITNANGLTDSQVDEIIKYCNNDIHKIDIELNRIKIFDEHDRKFILNQFIEDGLYSDVTQYGVFNLTNAIIKHDTDTLKHILLDIDKIDVEPVSFLSLLINNFKNVLKVQLSPNPQPETVNMPSKQFWAVKYNCGFYTKERLIDIYKFLTNLDKKIKLGLISTDDLINYIITYIF